MMRIEDMSVAELDAYINDLKHSSNPLHEIELVSTMYIAEAMKKQGATTVRELLETIPRIH